MNRKKIKLKQIIFDSVSFNRGAVPSRERVEWINYLEMVKYLTELCSNEIPGIERRGFTMHHIDHIISIKKGYELGIEPEKIADISNLRMMTALENAKKGAWR